MVREICRLFTLSTFFAFIVAALAVQLSPGPSMVLVASRTLEKGLGGGVTLAAGMTLGSGAIQIPLLLIGSSVLLELGPSSLWLLRLAGGGYLVYRGGSLALSSFRRRPTDIELDGGMSRRSDFVDGALFNLLNPKPLLFMLAFIPQFVNPAGEWVSLQFAVLALSQKASAFLVQLLVAVSVYAVGSRIVTNSRLGTWLTRLSAASMIAVGLYFLVS